MITNHCQTMKDKPVSSTNTVPTSAFVFMYVTTLFSVGRKAVFYFFLLWLDSVKPRQTFFTVTHTNKSSGGA